MRKILFLILFGIIFISFPARAAENEVSFNVDPVYDYYGRLKVDSFLQLIGENALFFVEKDYYQALDTEKQKEFSESLKSLSLEFDNIIYPGLRNIYGSEWKPGIDANDKITVLITRVKNDLGGYFNQGDEYPKAQVVTSNEREMLYFNTEYVTSNLAKSYLAHEFVHLITFNQKYRIYGASEDVWLNEARAELAPTLLGYDEVYEGSNLQRRVATFAQKSDDPLTEWKNAKEDYGVLNIFFQYLLDHYGAKILKDSLQSDKTGINSLNYALGKNAFSQDFFQIFTDWTIAVLINDCSLGSKYCYLNENLKNLRVLPILNYLPLAGESILTMTDYTKNWAGNWYKFVGGNGTLKLDFGGDTRVKFKVPYLTRDALANYSISFLELNNSQKGTIYINNFGDNFKTFIIVPSIQDKISGFGGIENYYYFNWSASIINNNSEKEEEKLVQDLLLRIEYLRNEIAKVQAQIAVILGQEEAASCGSISQNLYFGMGNNLQVKCLQNFLKSQGKDIYPEGLVTGNFYTLTLQAVIRFQEKYKEEILFPLGLDKGTGFVGLSTRAKINEMLAK